MSGLQDEARRARLAQALRENLKRRKAQARALAAAGQAGPDAAAEPPEPAPRAPAGAEKAPGDAP
jgi:hypothetical protein